MNELQQCLQELDLINGGQYPHKQMNYLKEHFNEALPYLYDALDNALSIARIEDDEEINKHNLYLYALYLLAEMKDNGAFPHIMNAFSSSKDELYMLYGDIITEELKNMLYITFNGDLNMLLERIEDRSIYVYSRLAMFDAYIQLYLDGKETKDHLIEYLRKLIHTDEDDEEFIQQLPYYIARLHLREMLDDLKYMYENDYFEPMIYGDYDSIIDMMYDFSYEKTFCEDSIDSYKCLRRWSMFAEDKDAKKEHEDNMKALEKMSIDIKREQNKARKKMKKIGRNDPCPCGSGKKYKKCCMYKEADLDRIEDISYRTYALKEYPKLRNNQNDASFYINDFYDEESIEIDKILYLGIKRCHPNPFNPQPLSNVEADRKCDYLLLAFDKYVDKFNKENLSSNEEYDQKYSIHYSCYDWLKDLLILLDEIGDDENYDKVIEYYHK